MKEIDPIVLERCAYAIFKVAVPNTALVFIGRMLTEKGKDQAPLTEEQFQNIWNKWKTDRKAEYFEMARACIVELNQCPCQGPDEEPGPHTPECPWNDPNYGEGVL